MPMNERDRAILAAEIGGLIKQAREGVGMSAATLAKRLDVSRQYIARIESGDATPNVRRLVEIAEILEVETAKILPD